MRSKIHYRYTGMQLLFHLLCNLCWWEQHFWDINTLRDWCEEAQWWMTLLEEVISPLFKIAPWKFSFLAQLCNPISGGFGPKKRLKASTSRALWDLCVQGHKSYLLVELLPWFPIQQSFGTGSPVHQPECRRVVPAGLCHSPWGIPPNRRSFPAPTETSGSPKHVGIEKCFQRVWKKDAFVWLASHRPSSCTWLKSLSWVFLVFVLRL